MGTPLGDYVRRARDRMGLTQTELAERTGMDRSHLAMIERGKISLPNADLRRRLARALGVSHQAILVAAGELTAEEAGLGAAYRPPFPDDTTRARFRRRGGVRKRTA